MQTVFEETLPPGAMWSARIRRGRSLRIEALASGANVSALFYNAENPLDRLNIPDTLKALHTAKITRGHVLMSDMGHSLFSVIEDSCGWHDPLGGCIDASQTEEKFGKKCYQEARNTFYRNSLDNFRTELAKRGLGLRDIVANLNFFSKVTVAEDGKMLFHPGSCREGDFVELRADLDCLAVLSNCPHPMAPPGVYPETPVRVSIKNCPPLSENDFCKNFRPECARALELTERYYL